MTQFPSPNIYFSASKSGTASLPLKNLAFVLEGKVDKEQLKKDIEKLGGRVSKTVRETTAAVISDEGRRIIFSSIFFQQSF